MKYYHKLENNSHHFIEVSEEKTEYLEIGKKEIKYRFQELLETETYSDYNYYTYKKILDNEIDRL